MILDALFLLLVTLISTYYSTGWNRPSSVNRSHNHIAFLDAKVSTMYFASVDDKAKIIWRFEN